MNKKLTSTIITFNEERNIGRCIDALKLISDEIIVLDSFSTDRTVEICEAKGVRVEQREWKGYSNAKNYLNGLSTHEYIFSVDADEAPDELLQKEILGIKSSGFEGVYSVNRLTNYCGKWIKHSGWYPNIRTRIFPKSISRWEGEHVHEVLKVEGDPKAKLLSGHLLHYSYYTIKEHKERSEKYSSLAAIKMYEKGKSASILKPYLSGLAKFFSMYILKGGFLDGKTGYTIARVSAAANVFRYNELRRMQNEG